MPSVSFAGLGLLATLSAAAAPVEIVARERDAGWTRIGYVLRPTTSSYIRCELALPDRAAWDGRLWGHGNGGWGGNVLCLRGMDGDTSAHVQCDLGTSLWQKKGFPAPRDVVDDFFWRATHLMTVEAKRLVREFYGRDADRAYFTGASTGGRQALFEATLYPDDYDGIIAEVPYFNWLDAAAYAWRSRQLRERHGTWFTEAERATIFRAELAAFAATDPAWARGRFIVDPRPTPERLDACWREIVRADPRLAGREQLWRALFEPVVVRGRRLACGAAIGMEFAEAWPFYYARAVGPLPLERVDEQTLIDLADRMAFDRGNPDLGAFRRRGGKLLMYAGYEDASVPAPPVTAFYEALARNMGGFGKVREFVRYYAVPGRSHGALGASFGKGQVGRAPDLADKLVGWVERGEVPQEMEFTFATRQARLAVAPYPDSSVRLADESAGERRERTEARPLATPGDVLAGVTFDGRAVTATEGVETPREIRRKAKAGAWEISTAELPVPNEPARIFSLTVRNGGTAPATLALRLADASRTAWQRTRTDAADAAVVTVRNLRPGASYTVFGGRIVAETPHARWLLGKIAEDGDGLFFRSQWAPLPAAAEAALDLQKAIDAKAAAGGGEVVVPAGTHEIRPFELRSGVTLRLAKGAVLLASTDIRDYPVRDGSPVLIGAYDATNVAIVGEGVIDGRGGGFRDKPDLAGESQPQTVPVTMRFSRCRDVKLEDFTYRNGAAWGIHLRNCDGVAVRRVKAFNHTNQANDGIDIESRNVLIEDCDLDTDDDAIVLKSESDPSFDICNVEVRNCRLASCCNAIKFGTGSYGLWRDVDIHDCVVARAGRSWRFDWRRPSAEWPHPCGGFPKGAPGVTNAVTGLAAIALMVVDGGRMERVRIRNIDIRSGYQTPVFIRMERRHPPRDGLATYLRDVLVENVRGTAESRYACSITGLPSVRPTGITLRNVDLRFPGGGTAAEAAAVPRECETDYPDCYMFDQQALPAWGFYIRHADDVRFENVKLSLDAPDARPQIVRDDVKDFSWNDPPAPPGPEGWGFRADLATPEADPAPPVDDGTREPWLKTRISRCFFSPIKRPPLNRDELADDIDYYPEAYLARLQREGVNGLWLTIRWRDLAETSFAPRAPDAPRKLAKLRRTVERCLKYGIRTYVFFIEPIFAREGDPLLAAHPELFGEPVEGMRVMCASKPEVRRYITESVQDLFTQVPGLGGTLSISHGERPTTCFSWVSPLNGSRRLKCPRCDRLEPWQLHNLVAESVVRGIRAAGSDARHISWFYQPQVAPGRAAWVAECARHVPDGVTLQYNFESGAVREQLGKIRHGGDYWLSWPGPSDAFRAVAEAGCGSGASVGAKIQVCNSHEMATVPYVPVPGLLYRKYREMRRLGVTEAMMCWYFGSYPGVMNRAAGLLAFEDFADGEDAFLRRLAAPTWGADAATVAAVWKRLSDAYALYPLSNNMQYYGPFACGVVWPLRPDIDLAPLARTWKPFDNPSGDLIGECLENHTLDEALALATRMDEFAQLPELDALAARWKANRARTLDLGVMKALTLHIRSARDIFGFYAARAEAVFASRREKDVAKALKAIDRMAAAIDREEGVTRAMLPLATADSRLGFHSEAETHQYHPAKLEWRLGKLGEAKRRLAEIRGEVAAGRGYPRSPFERTAPAVTVGGDWCGRADAFRLKVRETAGGDLAVTVRTPDRRPVRVSTLDALGLSVYRTWTFDADGRAYDTTINRLGPNHTVVGATAKACADGGYELAFTFAADGWGRDRRMRPGWIQLQVGDRINQWDFAPAWPERAPAEPRLNLRHEIADFARLDYRPAVEQ